MNALGTGRLGHAYLFIGPGSVGKTPFAMEFAKAMLCMEPEEKRPCGHCRSCQRFEHNNHPDFRRIENDGSSIKIEQIRNLSKEAGYLPVLSQRKVFFLGEVELMTDVAANGFLKTLEEPPASVVFLGVTNDENKVLPTIRSRFQGVRLSPVPYNIIVEGLRNRGCSQEIAEALAKKSRGLPGQAISSLTLGESEVWDWGVAIEGRDLVALLKKAAETDKLHRQQAEIWLSELEAYYRGRLMGECKSNPRRVFEALTTIQIARERLAANVNTRLVYEGLFLQLCS